MKTCFLLCVFLVSFQAVGQVDLSVPPFRRYPTVPALQLLLTDSVTKYTKADLPKKKPVAVMLFSPDCEHCQHEAQEIVANAAALKDVQFVLVTTYPLYRIKEFAQLYNLDKLPNVVVAKDPHYLLIPFFDVRNFPFLALYDKRGKLVESVEGSGGIQKVVRYVDR